MKIGEQLFSLRKLCSTPEDLAQTFRKVHEIGYHYVQLSGLCDCDPLFLRDTLAENQLEAVVCHANNQQLREDPAAVIAYYEAVGCPNIGLGAMPEAYRGSEEGYAAFIRDYSPAIARLWEHGYPLYYHNHAFDLAKFSDGSCILDRLVQDERISLLLDTYWLHMGGYDEVEAIRKAKGRCRIIHFKDWELTDNTPHFAPVLRGNLNWDGIYAACREIGVEYAFVEQDDVYGGDTFLGCAEISYRNMKEKGWLE